MRIVYFLPDVDGGVARVVKNLLQYRPIRNDISYVVVLFRNDAEDRTCINESFKADEMIRFSYSPHENAWSVFRRLAKTLRSTRDIIVGNDGFEIKMVAALKLANPVVYIMHGDFDYYYSIVSKYHQVINHCIAISNTIENKLKVILHSSHTSNITQLYFPTDSINRPVEKKKSLPFIIVFAGALIERKGADLLPAIEMFLGKYISGYKLLIIGDGYLMPDLKKSFDGNCNTEFTGWQMHEVVLKQLENAEVFLFPSRSEGLPNILLEALGAKAIPVASNLESGVGDILEDGINGLLAETADPSSYARAIIKLFNDSQLRNSLRDNAENVMFKFEPFRQSAAYEALYLTVYAQNKVINREYPKYIKGRLLDESWLPAFVVETIRKCFSNPKI